jgi:hypothetical protein
VLVLVLVLEPEPEPELELELELQLAREQVPKAELVSELEPEPEPELARDQVPEAALVPVPWKVRVRGSRKSTVSGRRCRSPRRRTPPAWKQPGGSTGRIARTRGQCLRT